MREKEDMGSDQVPCDGTKEPWRVGGKPTRLTMGDMTEIASAMDVVMTKILPDWMGDPSTHDTPLRFAKYLAEYSQPIDVEKIFGSDFESPDRHPPMIIQAPIPFRMACEHHLLPATGVAALAYIPHTRVLGLSKMTRLIDAVGTERPSLQEHIAHRIIDLMVEHLAPKGVMLVIKAEHGCMACRGVNRTGVNTITSHVQGAFRDNPQARQEALMLLQREL